MGNSIASLVFMPPDSGEERLYLKQNYKEWLHDVPTTLGNVVNVLFINKRRSYTILYSHGNAEDLALSVHSLLKLQETCQCNLAAYDYSGYGLSSGQPSEDATYDDIRCVFKWLVNECKIPPSRIILFGRSLGSGPTFQLAHETRGLAGMILQSPLKSVISTQTGFMVSALGRGLDMFKNDSKYANIRDYPVYIIHGTEDRVVPYAHGVWFYDQLRKINSDVAKHWVQGCGHNDIERRGDEFRANLKKFLQDYIFSKQLANDASDWKTPDAPNDTNNTSDASESKTSDASFSATSDESVLLYYQDLERLQAFCKQVNQSNVSSNSSSTSYDTNSVTCEAVLMCCKLSQWIYTASADLGTGREVLPVFLQSDSNVSVVDICFQHPENNQYTQRALLRQKCGGNEVNLYLVYKGTSTSDIKDLLADTGIRPFALLRDDKGKPQVSVHSGMYTSLVRDFDDIWGFIKNELKNGKKHNLYISGHSLGGGLSILFGLESIRKGLLPNDLLPCARVNVVTFGAPSVIVFDQKTGPNVGNAFFEISKSNASIINTLGGMTVNIVNKFDVIPRALLSMDWVGSVVLETVKKELKIALHRHGFQKSRLWSSINYSLPSLANMSVHKANSYVDSADWLRQRLEQSNLQYLLKVYQPVGTFYLFFSGLEPCETFTHVLTRDGCNVGLRACLSKIPENWKQVNYFGFRAVLRNHKLLEYLPVIECVNKRNEKSASGLNTFEAAAASGTDEKIDEVVGQHGQGMEWKVEGYMNRIEAERRIYAGVECGSGGMFWSTLQTKDVSKEVKYYLQTHKIPSGRAMSTKFSNVCDVSKSGNVRIVCEMRQLQGGKTVYRLIDISDDLNGLKQKMQMY